jgi:CrcB protein
VLVWAGVAVLGGLGAMLRVEVERFVSARLHEAEFPWGILAVNVSGSFVLGLLAGAALHGDALLFAGTATLGAYTTFSTWMLDTDRLGDDGERWLGVLNIVVSVLVGVSAAALGRAIA